MIRYNKVRVTNHAIARWRERVATNKKLSSEKLKKKLGFIIHNYAIPPSKDDWKRIRDQMRNHRTDNKVKGLCCVAHWNDLNICFAGEINEGDYLVRTLWVYE